MSAPSIARIAAGIMACVALVGCSETIHMKNLTTGEVATCGDHPFVIPLYGIVASAFDHNCVQDYKDQGFIRTMSAK